MPRSRHPAASPAAPDLGEHLRHQAVRSGPTSRRYPAVLMHRRDFIASTAGLAAVALVPEILAAPLADPPLGIAVIGAG